MNKKLKRLNLNRETIQSLSSTSLGKAAGGIEVFQNELDTHFDHTCGTVCDIPSWHCTRCSIC